MSKILNTPEGLTPYGETEPSSETIELVEDGINLKQLEQERTESEPEQPEPEPVFSDEDTSEGTVSAEEKEEPVTSDEDVSEGTVSAEEKEEPVTSDIDAFEGTVNTEEKEELESVISDEDASAGIVSAEEKAEPVTSDEDTSEGTVSTEEKAEPVTSDEDASEEMVSTEEKAEPEPVEDETKPEQPEMETVPAPVDKQSEIKDEAKEPENEEESEKECRKRPPYHERYYLRYGNEEMPESLDVQGTLELFRKLGYDNGFLKQARKAKTALELIEETYNPFDQSKRFCDFCGAEIIGTEFDRLVDGRDRCPHCSRTVVATEKDFIDIYEIVVSDLLRLFGVSVEASITIEMVNAQKLHKKLGLKFVPTNNQDGRVLGVAIKQKKSKKDKKCYFTILIENGSPRVSSMATLIHEMTHIWQYLNWDERAIKAKYGKKDLEVYEGMAKWVEIQYLYLIGEIGHAKREEIYTRGRNDEYGNGFKMYIAQYPFSYGVQLDGPTPFGDRKTPLG